jgi:hypothetical protein
VGGRSTRSLDAVTNLRFELLFLGGWVIGCLFLLAGAVAMWVYRIPGTSFGELCQGPRGQHPHRMLHQHTDMMRSVRPEKRRLIYTLQLTGATICASVIVLPFVINAIFPGALE